MQKKFAATLLIVLFVSCKSEKVTSSSADIGNNLKPKLDVGKISEFSASIFSPSHLRSNVPKDHEIDLSVFTLLETVEALKRIENNVSVYQLDNKLEINGDWQVKERRGGTEFNFHVLFKPSLLFEEKDYVIALKDSSDFMVMDNQKSIFHVGSLPRVKKISFVPMDKANNIEKIQEVVVEFSEGILVNRLQVSANYIENKVQIPIVFTLQENEELSTVAILKLANHLDINRPFQLIIEATILTEEGKKLDGLYTGKQGSGPFEAIINPLEFVSEGAAWEPEINF